ncbi:probable salivary secreted peptide [Leptopilina heterotoma]|uniref:probable salivary secreted peptide n=1 Tax=Leptopilina heterotoma TaxID=63436 RepID=UPI001CA95866|nr:probable salivary secreted peptide [Leptopilina heterotoma]
MFEIMEKTFVKFIFTIIVVILLLSVNSWGIPNENGGNIETVGRQSHHLIVGSRLPGDSDLTRDYIYIRPELKRIITIERIINITFSNAKITQVAAYDQKSDGTGAYAVIISGGPGFQHVGLRFVSQLSRGIDFVVELFGK